MKTFTREIRNLTDKTSMREMMVNIANFCSDSGFPEQVGIKEIQKIDKQSFIKYISVSHNKKTLLKHFLSAYALSFLVFFHIVS